MTEFLSSTKLTAFLGTLSTLLDDQEAADPEAGERVRAQRVIVDRIQEGVLTGRFKAEMPETPRRARRSDPETSHTAARQGSLRDGSMKHHILLAYSRVDDMNPDEARAAVVASGVHVPEEKTVPRRVSDLKSAGLLEVVIGPDGEPLERGTDLAGKGQVLRISDLGRTFLK